MIIELLLNLIETTISVLLTPIQMLFEPLGSMAGLLELFAYASIFVPINALGACLVGWLLFQSAKFTMVVVNWIIAKIPTID